MRVKRTKLGETTERSMEVTDYLDEIIAWDSNEGYCDIGLGRNTSTIKFFHTGSDSIEVMVDEVTMDADEKSIIAEYVHSF